MSPIEYIESCLGRDDQLSPLHIPYVDQLDFDKITSLHKLFDNCRPYPMLVLQQSSLPDRIRPVVEDLLNNNTDDLHKTGNDRLIKQTVIDHDARTG